MSDPTHALDQVGPEKPRFGKGWLITAVVLAVAGGAAGSLGLLRGATAEDPVQPTPTAAQSASTEAFHSGVVSGTVWVANEDGESLSIVDAATNRVITSVEGIEGPHNVQVAPDSRTVWAVSGHDSVAVVLDASTLDVQGAVPTGVAPAHVIVSPDGTRVYTSNGADDTVTVIDSLSKEHLATIPVGKGPHGMRPSPDGRWVFVANVSDSTLSVVDTATNTNVADIEVGKAPAQVAFSPDGTFVYATLSGEDTVVKIDVSRREVVGRVSVGDGPIQTYVSPDNRYVLAANQGTEELPGTTISVIDTATFTVTRTVETGKGPHGVVVDPSSTHAYVTNLYGDDVAVVDLHGLRVVARIPVGDKPNGISFSTALVDERSPVTVSLPERHGAAGQRHSPDKPGH
ncbi:beta-propeller fold lactonase family protein [Propioniciclava sinopodophylli]|uniref:YVTN family beta-propeller repeat protein n=1 Tax=Propioniciclava sinopodophylli TaxID=1837344 RepID=UPI002493AC60|nr:beta-propeller fold lactonase family protein [Propioniciclava sinopodophylli]